METSSEITKRELQAVFEKAFARTQIRIVPDKNDPSNLDKAMVWFITDDPYADIYIKLRLDETPTRH